VNGAEGVLTNSARERTMKGSLFVIAIAVLCYIPIQAVDRVSVVAALPDPVEWPDIPGAAVGCTDTLLKCAEAVTKACTDAGHGTGRTASLQMCQKTDGSSGMEACCKGSCSEAGYAVTCRPTR
jgi:hypothetical protein